MNDVMRWLLRMDQLRLGDPGVEFGFAREVPLWGWVLVIAAAIAAAWMCYRRLEGSRGARIALGAMRALTLMLLAVIVAGPRLLKPNETEESDWVLVLVDRSASLTVKDVESPAGGATRISRDEQLRTALEASRPVWDQLGAERVVVWLGFDGTAWDARVGETGAAAGQPHTALGVPEFGAPVGRRTDLNRALDAALKRAAARPLSGVVILSDGRSVDPPSRGLVRRLEAEKVPVFAVALGSERGVADLAIRRAEGPRTAFVNDTIPVQVEVERLGAASPAGGVPTATVELYDAGSGTVLDTQEVTFEVPDAAAGTATTGSDERRATATLVTRPSIAGRSNWAVRIRPSAGDGATDLVEDNNRAEVPIELVDRPLRVLYLDGYPRWEYRYLKNVLVRESSVTAAVTILAPGRRYIQEGTEFLDALPASPEEWAKWDVLVLGDVMPSVFTPEQLQQLRERVAIAGLGLVWIAGEGAVPDAWRGTPLGDLVPFTAGNGIGDAGSAAIEEWGEPVTMFPLPAAEKLGVLRLSESEVNGSWWPERLSDPKSGWAQLRWAQRIDPSRLKPTAEVLAVARPALARPSADPAPAAPGSIEQSPLVISMRFGAGRVIYVATDEIWRWRYGRGEYYTERFWLQIVRLLGRESVARSGKPAMLHVLPDQTETDRPVRIEITLLDQALVDAAPQSLRVRVVQPVGGGQDALNAEDESIELVLSPERASDGKSSARVFATTWVPTTAGRYRVEAIDPILLSAAVGAGASALTSAVQVWQPDDEMRQPQADHATLAALCQATGGRLLTGAELQQLPSLLPNRRLRLAGEPDVQTLWDTPLALILIVLLLTAEWVGRRVLRLA